MTLPPKTPLMISGVEIDYFDALILEVNPIYKELGYPLNFTGYTDVMEQFCQLSYDDFQLSYELAQALLAWVNYFSDLKNLTQKLLLDAETEKIAEIADASIKADSDKVSNGNRLANKDESVVKARKKRNALMAFHDLLESKTNSLNQAYYFCKSTCEWERKSGQVNT